MAATRTQIALAWLPAVLYMALIWALSSMSLPDLPLDRVPLRDKGVHFVEYGLLGMLVAHATLRTWPHHAASRTLPLAVLITLSWAVLDEIHQAFVPGRSAEALDLVADTAGALAGAGFRFAVRIVRRRLTA